MHRYPEGGCVSFSLSPDHITISLPGRDEDGPYQEVAGPGRPVIGGLWRGGERQLAVSGEQTARLSRTDLWDNTMLAHTVCSLSFGMCVCA